MFLLKVLTQQSVYALDREFYYLSEREIKIGVRVAIDFNNSSLIGFVLDCTESKKTAEELSDETGFNLKFVTEVIDENPILSSELFKLGEILKERYMYPLIGVLQTMLPPSLRPKKLLTKQPKTAYKKFYVLTNKEAPRPLTSREQKILDSFSQGEKRPKNEQKPSKNLLNLLNLGLIEEVQEVNYRYKINPIFDYHKDFTLSLEQEKVFNEIKNSNENIHLLYGVTGSGKTEIYIKLIEDVYKKGFGAIILVPEIALTPLMVSRLYSYFGNDIAVLHSSLTPSERYDEYQLISSGKARIVVGTRSAVFAPVHDLKLIIIDEENDSSYKEDDRGLLYNAIDVAKIRMKMNSGKLVLGSATPSIESSIKSKRHKYEYHELTERYSKIELPQVEIIDLNDRSLFSPLSSLFSLPVLSGIKNAISSDGKVILMINSKGYSKRYYCRNCGYVYKCPKCGLPLFYHKELNKLICHHCEHKINIPKTCEKCGSKFFSYGNFGIEKVEEDFKKIFPGIKYGVLDHDRTPKTKQIEDVLSKFECGEFKVLIGTQLVSKGHDFEGVNFVALLDADASLNYPNYRNNEITYSLLTQTIGRAGRFDKRGKAIIQTREPQNKVINFAAEQDYEKFLKYEYHQREISNYPPFYGLLAISIYGKNAQSVEDFALRIKNFFISEEIKDTTVLGPTQIYYSKGLNQSNVLIKYKKLIDIKESVEALISFYTHQNKVRVVINFNPYRY